MDSRNDLLVVMFILLSFVPYVRGGDPYHPACLDNANASSIEDAPNCIFRCPETFKTVCGTDGFTYYNECYLCRKACLVPKTAKACDGNCPCAMDKKHFTDDL